ncbi:MAG: serine hydrolase domain-containing protein [Chthoniobacteraceae bacterium]
MRFLWLPVLLVLTVASPAKSRPESRELAAISARMQGLVDRSVIAGSVTLVAQHGKTVHLAAVGSADIAARRAMKTGDLFWIASMTKPMTAVCVMMLAEQGRLSVDDPVEKFIPEFRDIRLGGARPPRPVTIRDLLTHTGGLGDAQIAPKASLAERVVAYAHAPMRFAPGSRWDYCNAGFNTLGRIIEVVSGKSYDSFLRQRLLSPLGMGDTTFWPSPRRVAKSYRPGGRGLDETSVYARPGDIGDRSRPALAAGGLFSTASDVARFYQMILNGGSLGSRRFLSAQTVRQMTAPQIGGMKVGFTGGMSWGLGFQIVRSPQGGSSGLSSGSFGHGGSFATQSWADPRRGAVYVLMIQRAGYAKPDEAEPRMAFQQAAAAALR